MCMIEFIFMHVALLTGTPAYVKTEKMVDIKGQ